MSKETREIALEVFRNRAFSCMDAGDPIALIEKALDDHGDAEREKALREAAEIAAHEEIPDDNPPEEIKKFFDNPILMIQATVNATRNSICKNILALIEKKEEK